MLQTMPSEVAEMDEQVLEELYTWIDQIPLSRPKKDLKRDFSDGGLSTQRLLILAPSTSWSLA